MGPDQLANMVSEREASPINSLLDVAPRVVSQVVEIAQPVSPETPYRLADFFNRSKPASSTPVGPGPRLVQATDEDDEDEYVPLTADEIKTKAASRAQMWAAVLVMFFGFLNRLLAFQYLRKGDKQEVKRYDDYLRENGYPPDYADEPDHPYHAARQRFNMYEEAFGEAEKDAELTDSQMDMMRKGVENDLKRKNKDGKLRLSMGEVLFEIAVMKTLGPMMALSMLVVNRLFDRTNK